MAAQNTNNYAAAVFKDVTDMSALERELTPDDALAVRRAVHGVLAQIIDVGQALSVEDQRMKEIEKLHRKSHDRCALAIIDAWLNQSYDTDAEPYSIEGYPTCPCWKNLAWAVSHQAGGQNPAYAKKIIKECKTFKETKEQPMFEDVDDTPFEEQQARMITDNLRRVRIKWYEIGVVLKMQIDVLDLIEESIQEPDKKMLDMLERWIREGINDPRPSWKLLLQAVAAPYGGGKPALAKELSNSHKAQQSGEQNPGSQPHSSENSGHVQAPDTQQQP